MLVTMGVRMICYTPIIGIGGVIFAVQKSVSLSCFGGLGRGGASWG